MAEQKLEGKTVKAAFSSLTSFACEFSDGTALLLSTPGQAMVLTSAVMSCEVLPRESDAVCKVDWSWIVDSKVVSAKLSEKAATLQLDKAGPLTISVQAWQGKPFLAFQPFRPA